MILSRLYEYYTRKSAFDKSLPIFGMEEKEIKFVIEIDEDGRFINLSDMRDEKKKGHKYLVPHSAQRSGKKAWQTAYTLWDHTGYVCERAKSETEKDVQMASLQNQTFLEELERVADALPEHKGVAAVKKFYRTDGLSHLKQSETWKDCSTIDGCNITFRLAGSPSPICEDPGIQVYAQHHASEFADIVGAGRCLVTGVRAPISRLHYATPVPGGQATGSLVSFQKSSGYDSYGMEQAQNAPVSPEAMFAYTTAINYLKTSPSNHVRLGNMTVLFWAASDGGADLEQSFSCFFAPQKDDPDKGTNTVRGLLESVRFGRYYKNAEDGFCILGLTPNSGRIAVSLWEDGTVKKTAERFARHFQDIEIVRPKNSQEYLTFMQFITATSLEDQVDRVAPNILTGVFASILNGTPYPVSFFQQVLRRVRAEQGPRRKHAAALKACINRWARANTFNAKEVGIMLDQGFDETSYQLGRAFAVLEKIQKDSSPGLNATIRDRYYGAASTSPVTVFPQLIKLKNHHVAKLSKGQEVYYERLLGEIFGMVSELPAHLAMQEQGYFALGYYHQVQDLYTKKEKSEENE